MLLKTLTHTYKMYTQTSTQPSSIYTSVVLLLVVVCAGAVDQNKASHGTTNTESRILGAELLVGSLPHKVRTPGWLYLCKGLAHMQEFFI